MKIVTRKQNKHFVVCSPYLLLTLKYHNTTPLVSCGKQFSRVVEFDCRDDVS